MDEHSSESDSVFMSSNRFSREVRVSMWGIDVTPLESSEVIQWVADSVGVGKRLLVGHNLHSVYLYLTDSHFQRFYDSADLAIADGFPVLMVSSLESKARWGKWIERSRRCGSTDWISKMYQLEAGTRIAVVGATSSSNAKAVAKMQGLADHLVIYGWDGFNGLENLRSSGFQELREFEPDVVLVGLGMPFQEGLLLDEWDSLPNAVYATVGGAIDQVAGVQRNAPRKLGPMGLEWLWRLIMDPRRLAGRYLVEPLKLTGATVRRLFSKPGSRGPQSRERSLSDGC